MSPDNEFPVILKFGPVRTAPGTFFNTQANGDSAIWLKVANVTASVELRFDEDNLPFFIKNDIISCSIPKKYYSRAGEYKIYLLETSTGMTSNIVMFTVK